MSMTSAQKNQIAQRIIQDLKTLQHEIQLSKFNFMDILAMSLAEHSFITAHPQECIRRSNEMSFETDSGHRIMVTRSTSNKVYFHDRLGFLPHPSQQGPVQKECDFILIIILDNKLNRYEAILIDWDNLPPFLKFDWKQDLWHTYVSQDFLDHSVIIDNYFIPQV